jgi:hypothetical protein
MWNENGPEMTRLVFGCEPMTNQRLTVWHQITVEFSGYPLSGSYAAENRFVKVKTPYGDKASQVGSFNSEWVATAVGGVSCGRKA